MRVVTNTFVKSGMAAGRDKAGLIPSHHREPWLATRLLKAVLAMLFAEILFVCAVTTIAAFAYFNPALRGEIEIANAERIEGWAYDSLAADDRLEVQLFIDHHFVAATRAEQQRDDLVATHVARNATHGFSFALAQGQLAPGRHRAQVYVVHATPGSSRTLLPVSKRVRIFEVSN